MIKAISFLTRKPGISREEFARHYEEVHAPLALNHFPFKRYARNYVIGDPDADVPGFAYITAVWFETIEDYEVAAELN